MPCQYANVGRSATLLIAVLLAWPAHAADEPAPEPTEFEWAFAGEAIGAGFLNADSWFGESEALLGGDTDQWFEFGVEPKLSFRLPLGEGTVFGALSVVGTYTMGDDASGLTIGVAAGDVTLEQAHVGWRVADPFDFMDGETFEVIVGNQDLLIGSGMLIADGASDGGERGGWYLSVRKAFHEALVLRLRSEDLLLEAFSLKNHPRAGGVEGQVVGINAEHGFGDSMRIGGTVMDVDTDIPGSDSLAVVSGRFDLAPERGFGVSAEYAIEDSDQIEATGYFAQLSYGTDLAWTPRFSYRYAAFSGDDPLTTTDERFREIAYGYTEYGSWFQGEITGDYPLGNGNLQSHMLRLKAAPAEGYTLSVIYYQFTLEHPASLGGGVTSDDWGEELDLTLDVELSDQWYLIGVIGVLDPGDTAVQWTGGDSTWLYSMLYLSYAW